MKYLLIIFSFLFLLIKQNFANSVVGKAILCNTKTSEYVFSATFVSKSNVEMYYLTDYEITNVNWPYKVSFDEIIIGEAVNEINLERTTLMFTTTSGYIGYCKVYNSKEELFDELNEIIKQFKFE